MRCSVATLAEMSTPSRANGRSHQSPSMVFSTESTSSVAARVPTPTGPMGQSELSMSMVCCARRPGGVPLSIRCPEAAAFACGAGEEPQPGAKAMTSAAPAVNTSTRRHRWRRLPRLAGAGNVHHNFEFQQRRPGCDGIGPVPGMGFDGGSGCPRLEGFFGLPVRHHEVAVFTLDRAKQLEAEEARRILDRMCAVGETLLQLGASFGGYLDCVDLHHWHSARLPCHP